MPTQPSLRRPCPPGTCDCGHLALLDQPQADWSILRLTRAEEKRLVERLENLKDFADLQHLQERMRAQLGIQLSIQPSHREVRSPLGLVFEFAQQPGLCRKTRQALPTAIRKSMKNNPEILFRLLDAHDLLAPASEPPL